uniref:Uncharacterized protein n=1 Tax=Pyxicephalus adspersus TaxID=30357 RepID=A0AAV2ZHG9_PYXAD|nr:TPA: hypothetical protein GDO54_002402 [Pyxicephalus adspersus]
MFLPQSSSPVLNWCPNAHQELWIVAHVPQRTNIYLAHPEYGSYIPMFKKSLTSIQFGCRFTKFSNTYSLYTLIFKHTEIKKLNGNI